ncbi:MAG: cytochrome c family protein, partial [Vicinamibacteria bacterium]
VGSRGKNRSLSECYGAILRSLPVDTRAGRALRVHRSCITMGTRVEVLGRTTETGFSVIGFWRLVVRFPALLASSLLIPVAFSHPVSTAQETKHEYVGSQQCRKCHIREFRSWEQTKMANVFDLLKPGVRSEQKLAAGLDPDRDYTKDAECLPCHTVGYGKLGGFVDLDKAPNHAGVGCECAMVPEGPTSRMGT